MTRKMNLKMLNAIVKSTNPVLEQNGAKDRAKKILEGHRIVEDFKKKRFDYLKKITKGRGRSLSNPFSGKNRAQRNRVANGLFGHHFNNRVIKPMHLMFV